MEAITKTLFDALMRYQGWPCASVYLPTHPGGFEGQSGRVRLKNLLAEAEEQLVSRGMRAVEARDFMASANELVGNEVFWRNQTEGLAVFASPEATRAYYLPVAAHELAVVNSRFHVAPLLPLVDRETDFYILTVSENRARFLKADRWHAADVALPDLPADAKEALHYDHPSDTRQFHTAVLGRGMSKLGAYHGSGNFFEHEKDELLEYFRVIDRALHPAMCDERAPLVFVGVDYLFPIYQQANTYPHLAEAHVPGNSDTWSDQQLHEKAWHCVAPQFEKPKQTALARYSELPVDGLKSDDLRVILGAACQGQVESLLVDAEQPVWGKWDDEHRRLRLDPERRGDSNDMLDLAIVQTLAHRGAAYSVPSSELRHGKRCEAIFRYELAPSAR
ncbi:MAG TPA: hypothetical protein VMV10_29245 [Pirellulales bacterium]|nr:hypothetical protein [Pirellulales bacterium]